MYMCVVCEFECGVFVCVCVCVHDMMCLQYTLVSTCHHSQSLTSLHTAHHTTGQGLQYGTDVGMQAQRRQQTSTEQTTSNSWLVFRTVNKAVTQ